MLNKKWFNLFTKVLEILESLSTSISRPEENLESSKVLISEPDPPANMILESLYKWVTGSGRIVWFTTKLTTAYKPETQKGSPYFNIEVDLRQPALQ